MLDEEGRQALTPAAATKTYQRGLEGIVNELVKSGIGVVILQNIPEPDRITNNHSIINKIFPRKEPTAFDPLITLENREGASRVEANVARTNPDDVVVFDPFSHLCPETEGISKSCPLTKEGESIYQDSSHLTPTGSRLLIKPIARAIQTAADGRLLTIT